MPATCSRPFATTASASTPTTLLGDTAGHGISQSIVARMQSIGGHATITSSPDSGTEVSLWTRNPNPADRTI